MNMKLSKKICRTVAAAAVAAVVLTGGVSCNRSKKSAGKEVPEGNFRIEKVENFRANSFTSYELDLSVANPTRYAFRLEAGTVDILYAGSRLGTITADGEVEIPKRATTSVTLPLSLSIENPLAIYSAYTKLQRGELDKITLKVRATVRTGAVRKDFEQNDIPLQRVLTMLGVDASNIKNILSF